MSSSVPPSSLPLTGGMVVAGQAVGLQWVAAFGLGLVLFGFALIRYGRRRPNNPLQPAGPAGAVGPVGGVTGSRAQV